MILDTINHAAAYYQLGPRFEAALRFLQAFDPTTPAGRISLDGDNLYALVQDYTPTPADGRPYEAHHRYADIQYVAAGEEIIHYAPLATLRETAAYLAAGDYALYAGSDDFPLLLTPGRFTILLPQDGHKPACLRREKTPVRKIVMKVLL